MPKKTNAPLWTNAGHCPICAQTVTFNAWGEWLRDYYICSRCGSIPRERHLMLVLDSVAKDWRQMAIHESSPAKRGVSQKLQLECAGYVATQFSPDIPKGEHHPTLGWRNENLERQTFAAEAFDLVITQDVMEHVFRPDLAFAEIARTLKPGGMHVYTTPLVYGFSPSRRRARMVDGEIVHELPPVYHGNPIDPDGSLVTVDWGYDIAGYDREHSGLDVIILNQRDRHYGIDGEYLEVVISRKLPVANI